MVARRGGRLMASLSIQEGPLVTQLTPLGLLTQQAASGDHILQHGRDSALKPYATERETALAFLWWFPKYIFLAFTCQWV